MRGLRGRRALVTGALDREACASAALELGGAGTRSSSTWPTQIGDGGDGPRPGVAGGLDVLVNNAGIVRDGRLERTSDEDWRAVPYRRGAAK